LGLAPNAIKIDVEGAEVMLLRGAMNTLRTRRPVVVLELHWLPEMGVTPDAVLTLFNELGYVAHEPITDRAITESSTLRRINGVVLKPDRSASAASPENAQENPRAFPLPLT
jgi:hypothetical protein